MYVKAKICSGSHTMGYLWKTRKKRILVVCGKFPAESGAISYIPDALDFSNTVDILGQAVPGPTIEVVGKGFSIICRARPEIVIDSRSGSVIDTAKRVTYFAGMRDLVLKPKFITIPITSGTDPEVISAAVVTDSESKSRHLIPSGDILVDVIIFGSRLALPALPSIAVNIGMDVLTHALEAHAVNRGNVFLDALSEKATELLIKALLQCYRDGRNPEARALMYEAPILTRMAFNTTGPGLDHNITHQPGGTLRILHGLINALLSNQIIDYNNVDHDIMSKYADLVCRVQSVDVSGSPVVAVNTLKELVHTLMRYMEISSSIRELGINIEAYEEQLQNMTDNALMDNCFVGNPREAGTGAIKKILLGIY